METSSGNNIILFPKWKKKLEKESLEALKNNEYAVALEKLNKLLSYHVNNAEIITGKLICLMELDRYQEAQDLCEQLIRKDSDHYFEFVHIYLTILFQTSQYEMLMEQAEIELAKKNLPQNYRVQFKQLYELSEKMKLDVTAEKNDGYLHELFELIEVEDHQGQWRLVESLRKGKAYPVLQATELLTKDEVHPVVKTAICHWLKDAHINREVAVHKFNKKIPFNPAEATALKEQKTYQQLAASLGRLEHENPTLNEMLKQVLYRYAYVLYPFFPPGDDRHSVEQALIEIGETYLNIHNHSHGLEREQQKVEHYIEEITVCESLYMSVIDD